jgi:hypothetical protein
MTIKKPTDLSRRHLIARIGTLAVAAYTVPAFTTMSMAHASSGASAASSQSSASEQSAQSSTSTASGQSKSSGPSNLEECEDYDGEWDDDDGICIFE